LSDAGAGLVFVLRPQVFGLLPRCGCRPAGVLELAAPYPIPETHTEAWTVQELCPGVIGRVKGTVQSADALDRPEHWRE
jgi:hypothetical protein